MATPKSRKDVQCLLGMANYYREFLPNFAERTRPLYNLLKGKQKRVPFEWKPEHETALTWFKQSMSTAPVLTFFDPSKKTIVATDASGYALGAILKQVEEDENGKPVEKVIAYYSRLFTAAEQKYTVTEKEGLCLIAAIKKWHPYLHMRPFTVETDHCALKYLPQCKLRNGRLIRWSLMLQEFDISIVHKTGKKHCDADCLSRLADTSFFADMKMALPEEGSRFSEDFAFPEFSTSPTVSAAVLEILERVDIEKSQRADPFSRHVMRILESEQLEDDKEKQLLSKQFCLLDNRLHKKLVPMQGQSLDSNCRLYVPRDIRNQLLNAYHEGASHPGNHANLRNLRVRYWWPGMRKTVYAHIRACDKCAERKVDYSGPAPIKSISADITSPIPGIFSKIGIDVMHIGRRSSSGKRLIVTAICYSTKYAVSKALSNERSDTICDFLVHDVFNVYGIPLEIVSDNGSCFRSDHYQKLAAKAQARPIFTSGYRPTANSVVERVQGSLKNVLHFFVRKSPGNWDKYVSFALWAYNTSVHSVTGFAPYFLVFGCLPRGVVDAQLTPKENSRLVNWDKLPSKKADQLRWARSEARRKIDERAHNVEKRVNKTR